MFKRKGEGLLHIIKQVVMIFVILHSHLGFEFLLAACLERNLLEMLEIHTVQTTLIITRTFGV